MSMSLRSLFCVLSILALTAGAAGAQTTPSSQPGQSAFDTPAPSYRAGAVETLRSSVATKDHTQVIEPIACGETVSGDITTHDFELNDGSFFDFFEFVGLTGETVIITMTSNAINPYLFLVAPNGDTVAEDDDSAQGNNARITFNLDEDSNFWTIAANAFDPGSTGPYALSLECPGVEIPAGSFRDAEYPDFLFRVMITAGDETIQGTREPNCQPETVCVSGALPGRSELFIRILGPRPNGFLWPTLVRFTPSEVEVDILQISTSILRNYVLEAIPPGTDELPGLQDRTGFLP